MEDAHIVNTSLSNDVTIFGVFDGHGGSEISEFVSKNFCLSLAKN